MYLGVDYYPEQWGLDLIDEDLKNIKSWDAILSELQILLGCF